MRLKARILALIAVTALACGVTAYSPAAAGQRLRPASAQGRAARTRAPTTPSSHVHRPVR